MTCVALNPDFESGSGRIRHHRSPFEQPQDQREDDADDQRCDDREIKAEVFALDDDFPGQPAEAQLLQQWLEQPWGDQQRAEDDQPAAHREILAA